MEEGQREADDQVVLRRVGALAELETSLATISDQQPDPSGRDRARNALVALHKFLVASDIPHASLGPIVHLVVALDALDAGSAIPLVNRNSTGSRPRLADGELLLRVVAAAALELRFQELKKSGEENASQWVAGHVRHWVGVGRSDRGRNGAARMIRWREDVTGLAKENSRVWLYKFLTDPGRNQTARLLLETEPQMWGIQIKKS